MRSRAILGFLILVFLARNAFGGILEYNIIDLGNFGGSAYAHSINNLNQITINRHVGGGGIILLHICTTTAMTL